MNVNITIRLKAISKNEFFTEFSQAIRMWNSIYGYNYYGYNGILSLEEITLKDNDDWYIY